MHLRTKDLDFAGNQIVVRDGKGNKDTITMLPQVAKGLLAKHLKRVRGIHGRDLQEGHGRVFMPYALGRKYPSVAATWQWQYAFPAQHRFVNRQTGAQGRHRVHEGAVQRAVKETVPRAGVAKRATFHTFLHSFATHLLKDGYDMRTVQKPLGHKDLKTTMIHTHVLNRGGKGMRSPVDAL